MCYAHQQMNENNPQISFSLRSETEGCMYLRSLFTLEEYICPGIHYSIRYGRYSPSTP
jgi:hypothetical protein